MSRKTYNPFLIDHARAMRRSMTEPERRLWLNCLRKLPYRFRRQRPIDRYIVDFYCAELRLVIEVDGDSHYNGESAEYDRERTAFLNSRGLRVIRFTNREIMDDLESIRTRIFEEIHLC